MEVLANSCLFTILPFLTLTANRASPWTLSLRIGYFSFSFGPPVKPVVGILAFVSVDHDAHWRLLSADELHEGTTLSSLSLH